MNEANLLQALGQRYHTGILSKSTTTVAQRLETSIT